MEDSLFNGAFDDTFAAKHESFLIIDELEYDVSEFDDLCSTSDCLRISTTESNSHPTSVGLKPLCDTLKYSFSRPNESLPMIIATDLD